MEARGIGDDTGDVVSVRLFNQTADGSPSEVTVNRPGTGTSNLRDTVAALIADNPEPWVEFSRVTAERIGVLRSQQRSKVDSTANNTTAPEGGTTKG